MRNELNKQHRRIEKMYCDIDRICEMMKTEAEDVPDRELQAKLNVIRQQFEKALSANAESLDNWLTEYERTYNLSLNTIEAIDYEMASHGV